MTGNLADALVARSASQDVPAYRRKLEACKGALLEDQGLHHIAHYTGGVLDFAVDILAYTMPDPPAEVAVLDARREMLRRVGAQLVYRMGQLNRRLLSLRSGVLIRTAAQTDHGVLFCNLVVGEQCVVAFGFPPEPAGWTGTPRTWLARTRDGDRTVSTLATRLRALMSQTSMNPGGWLTVPQADQLDATQLLGLVDPAGTPFQVYRQGSWDEPADLLRLAVEPDFLHYVAYYQEGQQFCSADVLEQESLAPFFSRLMSPVERRAKYDRLGRDLAALARQIGMDLAPAIGGAIGRLVLDVEQGAVYQYRMSNGNYLVGVTLNQERVSVAEDRMAELATDCELSIT